MTLTIAIPSFNRGETARESFVELYKNLSQPSTPILLANNGSEIGSYNNVKTEMAKISTATYIEFDANKGFALNLTRLLSQVKTRYALLLSDEDVISSDSIEDLIEFLKTKNPPLVILREDKLSSKRLKARRIKGASSYISGVVLNVELVREILPKFEILIESEEFASIYPHVLLAAYLNAKGKSFTLSKPRVLKRVELPMNFTGNVGEKYWLPTERVHQYLSLMRCLDVMSVWVDEIEEKELARFRNANRASFFGLILDSVKTISPEILGDLTRSSFKTSLNFELKKSIKSIKCRLRFIKK